MRRHYRNHSMAAAADVHPPRHNSGRRPRGYQRTHPARFSRTVFHSSSSGTPIHLLQSAPPSVASMTDDDDDDMGEEDGEGSGMDDDENEFDDMTIEDMDMSAAAAAAVASPTHHKSVTWSPSPSPTDHTRTTRSNQDSESRIIAPPPCSSPPRHLYSSSSSSSGSRHTYVPSSPAYIQACRDSTVSTTLRPAFR